MYNTELKAIWSNFQSTKDFKVKCTDKSAVLSDEELPMMYQFCMEYKCSICKHFRNYSKMKTPVYNSEEETFTFTFPFSFLCLEQKISI